MAAQRVLRIRYTSREGTTTARDVEPVLFASTSGRWYLVGWCLLRDTMRWFAVSRIEHAAVTMTACNGHTIQEIGEPPVNARPVHGGDE
ncbi:WYL domain-containing protein [uncultured Corynebacterium sp.]|uniref:helix-turn-helix transcriptional regulator n=1 Tax=uncultured Corynebacterium sp. TaxID=159447 RepID=UPI00288ABD9D|nr:WYL domain-containing protein [uncultured Corynebacterium sp.]